MIIDATDFIQRPYKVPNQPEARDFVSIIESLEKTLADGTILDECCSLLGVDLWSAFEAGLASSGTVEQHWLDLKNGSDYQYAGKTYKYSGWVNMIRPGIFAKWIPETTFKLTNIGFVENSAPDKSKLMDDNYPFIVKHWNEFARAVGYQPECGYNYKNSFYGFMKANESNYPEWVFKCPTFKNRHDL
jgi:hypothetical protein